MVWPTKDVGDISDMLQMKTSSWLSQCMTTMAGLFITIAANVQDVASEMRHIHIGSTSDEEEEEDEEEEKEAMEKEPQWLHSLPNTYALMASLSQTGRKVFVRAESNL